jgi:hypothetical protein
MQIEAFASHMFRKDHHFFNLSFMYKITVGGSIYISKYNCINDTVFILPHTFVRNGKIKDSEWAKSREKIVDRF